MSKREFMNDRQFAKIVMMLARARMHFADDCPFLSLDEMKKAAVLVADSLLLATSNTKS